MYSESQSGHSVSPAAFEALNVSNLVAIWHVQHSFSGDMLSNLCLDSAGGELDLASRLYVAAQRPRYLPTNASVSTRYR